MGHLERRKLAPSLEGEGRLEWRQLAPSLEGEGETIEGDYLDPTINPGTASSEFTIRIHP